EKNLKVILPLIFPETIKDKVFAYLPSDGDNCPPKIFVQWREYAKKYGAKLNYIDNSKTGEEAEKEKEKLLESNILTITGGNTFTLLHNLRRSGLDKSIIQFTKKKEFVLSGFSAGAVVLTPTIATSAIKGVDKNKVGLKNLKGLKILKFEIFAHYSQKWEKAVEDYEKKTKNEVKKLTDEDYLVIDLK
ncbi:Type 1 glutamine amidotransferase-like domain-containing protein, partial [Patescibacteria group bacterium]